MNHKKEIETYINKVLSGEIISCDYVKKACQRYLDDHNNTDIYFDEDNANRVINFIQLLKHVKGEKANNGECLILESWQKFIVWNLFGWKKKKDNLRRFKNVYVEVPRKNGKSTLLSGVGNYLFLADGEEGAECYTAATKKDQAAIIHSISKQMIDKEPTLKSVVEVYKTGKDIYYLSHPARGSKYEPLGKDSSTLDGLNPHAGLIDEYHAHKDKGIYDQLRSGMGARSQPILFIITTAGNNTSSPCYFEREYVINILNGIVQDDSYFGVIWSLDKDDDWKKEENWYKANPNLGISKKIDDMKDLCTKAIESPIAQTEFKTKHLNMWLNVDEIWITVDKWDKNNKKFDLSELDGKLCYGAFDLSTNIDITAWTLCFPPDDEDGEYRFIHKFFIPKDNMLDKINKDKVPYDVWVDQGYVCATEGDVIDYHFIEEQIIHDLEKYNIKQIAYDKYNASDLVTRLQERGVEDLTQYSQSWSYLSPASKQFEEKALAGKMNHNMNPVIKWMVSCTSIKQDVNGNIRPVKPDRKQSGRRIDGVITSMMSLDLALKNIENVSVYETEELFIL